MAILNFGSLNIDHVYTVEHIARPGETLGSGAYEVFAGGKGANQSAALALAGAPVRHAGRIGVDGRWLLEGLAELGVDISAVVVDPDTPTGHAIIQVESGSGENAIILYPGCNRGLTSAQIGAALESAAAGDIVLLQNEINGVGEILTGARARDLTVCWNPAPFDASVPDMPLEAVDLLVVNQTEAAGLAGDPALDDDAPPEALLAALRRRLEPRAEILLTLGAAGAVLDGPAGRVQMDAIRAGDVVDTTAAGDTFIGYFLAARAADLEPDTCLRRAAAAAGICVTRPGARPSIPAHEEVHSLLGE